MDEPSGETLRFSGHWILTNVFVTQPNILTCIASTLAYAKTSPAIQRSPTDHEYNNVFKNPTASADYLVPAIVGAKTLY